MGQEAIDIIGPFLVMVFGILILIGGMSASKRRPILMEYLHIFDPLTALFILLFLAYILSDWTIDGDDLKPAILLLVVIVINALYVMRHGRILIGNATTQQAHGALIRAIHRNGQRYTRKADTYTLEPSGLGLRLSTYRFNREHYLRRVSRGEARGLEWRILQDMKADLERMESPGRWSGGPLYIIIGFVLIAYGLVSLF